MKFIKIHHFDYEKVDKANELLRDQASKVAANGVDPQRDRIVVMTIEHDNRPDETWKDVALAGMNKELNECIAVRVSLESDRRFFMSKQIENPSNSSAENALGKCLADIKIQEAKIKYMRDLIKEIEAGVFKP